jgi:hypothetical protein
MKPIKQFLMPLLMIFMVILGISPHVNAQGVITFTSNGTFTVPPGVTSVTYKIWAAGGGAGLTPTPDASGGGGGGAYVQVTRSNLTPGQTYAVVVGVGGAPGSSGGASSVDGSTAQGGKPGVGSGTNQGFGGRGGSSTTAPFNVVASGANFSAGSSQQGGDGGAATSPDALGGGEGGGGAIFGSDGSPGVNGGTSPNTIGGSGGSVTGGDGGNQGANGVNGGAVGGGGGGRGEGAATTGGTGANGKVEISYTCPTLTSISYGAAPSGCISQAGFSGAFAPSNWTLCNPNGGNGTVNTAGAPSTIILNSAANNGFFTNVATITNYQTTIPCSGTITVNWSFVGLDGAFWDPFGYSINGTFNQLTNSSGASSQSGSATITVTAGQLFAFTTLSDNFDLGSSTTTSSFTFTPTAGQTAFCNSSSASPTLVASSAIGGTFTSSTLGASLNASTGVIAAGAPAGIHTITYGWPAANGCPLASVSTTVAIGLSPSITTFTYPSSPFCSNNNSTVGPTIVAQGANGTASYTGPGILGGFNCSGSFNPSLSGVGTYTITYTIPASNGCPSATATTTVTITALPTITGFDYPGDNTYCAGEGIQTPSSTITNPNNNAVVYSYVPVPASANILTLNTTTGAINPATSTAGVYKVYLTIAAGGNCGVVKDSSIVEILARPTAIINYGATNVFCQTVASTLQPVTITGVTGGALTLVDWTTAAPALIINSSGAIDLNSPPGTYVVKYRFTGLNGCLDSASRSVTINARPTSTITYPAGINPVCSNVSPVLSGVVTAVGAWTLTLSNGPLGVGQTVSGTGNGPWSITINTLDPGETETYTVTSLVDANCSGVANPDMPGSVTITKRTVTSGVIPNAASIKVCENQDASVNVILTSPANNCAPNPQFSGVFRIEKWNGLTWVFQSNYSWTLSPGSSTTGIAATVTIPASLLPNPTSTTLLYRVAWVSLTDCNGCTATPLIGTQVLEVVPVPILTVSAGPTGDVCPGSNIVFDVLQAAGSTVVGATFNWVATDAQGNVLGSVDNDTLMMGAINTNLGLSCPYNNTITFTITPLNPNCCNCLGIPITRTVVVRDIIAPVWNVANLDRTLECSDLAGIALAQALKPVATDNCDNNVTNIVLTDSIVVANPACPQAKTITKKWTVTDDCGNTSVKFTQVITLQDTQAPVLTGTIPAGQTGINNCLSNAPTPPTTASIAAQYTDNCGTVSATLATVTTGTDCGWTVTHTYTVKDNCGNIVAVSPVIVYSGADANAPTIGTNTFPAGQTGINNCLSNAPAGATIAAIAALYTDNCGGTITVVKTTVTTGTDCGWTVTYTYSIKDKCNNEVLPRPTQVFSGADATAPTIGTNTFPAGGTGLNLCLSAAPAGATEAAIAALYSDNCGGLITVVKTTVTTGTDCGWTVTYTYSIKDKCNNEVLPRPTQVFSGADATAPTIGTNTFPAGGTGLNLCLSAAPAGATEAAIAALYSDNCGGLITVVKTTVTTGTDCGWTVTYTYSIKDKCNNEVLPRPTQVYSGSDQTAPSIGTNTFPVGQTGINSCYSATLPVGPLEAAIAALYTDNCGGLITVVKTRVNNSTNNCNWSITYTYSIKDKCNNEVLPRPTVTYTGSDQSAPVFTSGVIPDQTLNTGAGVNCSAFMPSYIGLFTATDCSGVTFAQLAPNAIGTEVFGFNGYRTVVVEATDACGNKTKDSVRVFLKDLTAPNAICKPFTLILNANGTGTIVLANVNNGSFDNCTPTPQLVYNLSQTNFTCANVGPNNVTLSVTDLCGNVGTCVAVVTVVDNTPPVITCFGDTTISKDANCTYTMPDLRFRVNRADACGGLVTTQNPAIGAIFGASIQMVTVTLTVTDANGNASNCTFRINFVDVTPPVIFGCPGNITVNTGFGNTTCSAPATWIPPTATDACIHLATQTQPITSNYQPGAIFPVGTTTVTYTATDVAGNTSICSFTVTVVDNTLPVIAGCPGNVSVNTGLGRTTCNQVATWTEPTATDNCTAAASLIRTRSHAPGATFPVGTTTVTYTFTDLAGNVSLTCSFTVTVVDNTAPIFTACPPNIVNPPINTAGCIATVATTNPTFTDNCGVTKLTWALTGVTTASSPATGINYVGTRAFNFGVTTVTYTATDAAGNTATCTYTVTVTRPLTAAISGTSTVLQNNTTTSTIGFTSRFGTAPYTIVYSTTAGGYPSAGTFTLVTTTGAGGNSSTIGGDNNWLVTTVPQSNAVPGTYTYTLVSVTDAFGCVVTPGTTAVVTVVPASYPAPDLTPNIATNGSSLMLPGQTRTGYLELYNIADGTGINHTSGLVAIEVYNPSNFTLNIGASTTTVGATTVQNNSFDIVYYAGFGYTIQTKPGVTILAGTSLKIGYTVTTSSPVNNQGNLLINIINQTGGVITAVGDNNDANNQANKLFKIVN